MHATVVKVTLSDPEGSVAPLVPTMLPDGVTLESIEVREVVAHA